jgi:hopene-associated glycosyltransferase HpnB
MLLRALATIPLLSWCYLLLGRGGFWRASAQLLRGPPPVAAAGTRATAGPRIVAVIPARDEAPVIGAAVRSLLLQDYAGPLHVIVIDDGSSDGTSGAAMAAAADVDASDRLTVRRGAPLPPGWTGKLWAMSQGVAAATALRPDYLLFTDADIHHDPGHLTALVSRAQANGRDLVSCMVELPVVTFAEQCLVPAFVFFFLMLYPPRWISSSRKSTAGAAGGCMLMRPQALVRSGGLQAIRAQIIDDCALARITKSAGGTVWLGLTHGARCTRSYGSFAGIGRMISRSAFNQLGHSYLLLAATLAGLAVAYLLPPVLLLSGDGIAALLGAAAWGLMTVAYAPMVRFYRRSPLWSLCLPVIAVFYVGATAHSALQFARRRGGLWKGRVQDLRE